MTNIYAGTDAKKAYELAEYHNAQVSAMKMGRGGKSWVVYHVWVD